MARFFKPTRIAIGLMAVMILIGTALALGYASLPAYLEKRLLPKLAADAGLPEIGLKVRRVGLFGADLAQIRIGTASEPGLVLDAVQIDYTPTDLLHKTIDRVVIKGLQLNCHYENGRLQLDDSLRAVLKSQPPSDSEKAKGPPAALPFNRLALRHASVRLKAGDRVHTVPFELDFLPENASGDQMTVEAIFWPRDQRLEAHVQTDLEAGSGRIRLKAAALQLNAFADLIEPIAGLRLGGTVKIDGSVDLALAPIRVSAAEATLEWFGDGIEYRAWQIRPAPAGSPRWQMKVKTADGGNWHVSADPLLAASEVVLQLSGLKANIQPSSSGYEIAGRVTTEPVAYKARRPTDPALSLTKSPRIDGSFNASINRTEGWTFAFEGTPTRPQVQLEIAARRLNARLAPFRLSARGHSGQITAEYNMALAALKIRNPSLSVSAAALSLKGKTRVPAASPNDQRTEVSLTLSNAAGGMDKLQFGGANAAFYGILRTREATGPQIYGTARFSAATLTAADASVQIQGAGGKLPLSWPLPKTVGKAGHLHIASLRFRKWALYEFKGVIRQTNSGLDVEGRHTDAIIPGLAINFSGKSQLVGRGAPAMAISVDAARSENAAPIDLGTLLPGGQGMVLSGRLNAGADLRVEAGGVEGTSTIRLTGGQLRASKENFKISGIQLGLTMPGLPALRSGPGQQLRFASANLGDIQLKQGHIFFQLEPAPALLLEKGQFDWCEGRVDMHSTRIFLDRDDYALTLFCDRLNLARLLEQFGAADAEGSGTVSGKIPIRYRDRKLSVADGFLFSSPGEGGQIRLQGTEMLTAGIPTDSPQYMQLEIAREALKDYDFSWAKLTVTTEGEDMLLKLQLDGKPATTLPFVFRKDIGGFARVDGKAQGSTFQGIRLDVNFRLPLNKILQYKSIIQMIRQKGAN